MSPHQLAWVTVIVRAYAAPGAAALAVPPTVHHSPPSTGNS